MWLCREKDGPTLGIPTRRSVGAQEGSGDSGSGRSYAGRYSHDFSLGAVGSRGQHLQALDVLEVNPSHGLQALTAQLIGDRRPYGRRLWISGTVGGGAHWRSLLSPRQWRDLPVACWLVASSSSAAQRSERVAVIMVLCWSVAGVWSAGAG